MKKNLFAIMAIAAFTLSFIACDDQKKEEPQPTPTPSAKTVTVRFYVSEDQVNLTDIAFLAQVNGASKMDTISPRPVAVAVDSVKDRDMIGSIEALSIKTPLHVFQTSAVLQPEVKHKYQMTFKRNSVETQQAEMDIYCGIAAFDSIGSITHNPLSVSGGTKVDGIQNYLDKHVNIESNILQFSFK